MTNLKELLDAQWQAIGVKYANHGTAWLGDDVHNIHARAGTARNYMDKETKRRRAKLAMYNDKLRNVILAEATVEQHDVIVPPVSWRDEPTIEKRPRYTWPAHEKAAPVESVPRKRVSRVKLAQAQEILAKVPQDELAAFLARFGLSMSLAASIASLDNVEQIARQFLRATL